LHACVTISVAAWSRGQTEKLEFVPIITCGLHCGPQFFHLGPGQERTDLKPLDASAEKYEL
jgi:hypothetical protein